jgi:hypothetical protein
LARQVLTLIKGDPNLTQNQLAAVNDGPKSEALVGFLSVMMVYLKCLQVGDGVEGVKSRLMFFGRNSFSDLYGLLDPEIQGALANNNGALLKTHLLAVSNGTPLLGRVQGQTPDTNLQLGAPLVNSTTKAAAINPRTFNAQQEEMASFTIQEWLESVSQGQDHLTATAMALWLQNNANKTVQQSQDIAEPVFESFAEYPLDVTGAEPLALFENRGIGKSDEPFDKVMATAIRYMEYMVAFKKNPAKAKFKPVK